MKQRAISALIMIIICVPLLILGGLYFNIGVFILAMLALKEFLDIKETKKRVPSFVKVISYAFLVMLIAINVSSEVLTFQMDYRVISGLLLTFLVPTILYHDREKYSINDAFYLIGGLFFLALSMILLINVRSYSLMMLIYLLLITIMTDTFAYLTGMLIGRNKLIESISPKKTWEGTIGGTAVAVFVSTMFYITTIDPDMNIYKLIFIGTFLSILGQFGDLFFSAIKRYYGKKDFSNLIPGHGGILDRMDSIIFVLLGFMFFISIL
jgi:phosphatidate cytidylyltransferase